MLVNDYVVVQHGMWRPRLIPSGIAEEVVTDALDSLGFTVNQRLHIGSDIRKACERLRAGKLCAFVIVNYSDTKRSFTIWGRVTQASKTTRIVLRPGSKITRVDEVISKYSRLCAMEAWGGCQ